MSAQPKFRAVRLRVADLTQPILLVTAGDSTLTVGLHTRISRERPMVRTLAYAYSDRRHVSLTPPTISDDWTLWVGTAAFDVSPAEVAEIERELGALPRRDGSAS